MMENERIEFAPYQMDEYYWNHVSIFIVCRDCNFLSGSILSDQKDGNHCKNCDSMNLMYLPTKFTEKYKGKTERKISDAELLQILIQMD